MSRRFTVVSLHGHIDVTSFSDIGPIFVEVMCQAENANGERIEFRRTLNDQPRIGEVVEFEETK